jgi:hypothetical protein
MIVPGCVIEKAADSALRVIASCVSRSCGGPAVLPSGKSVKTARGGFAAAVILHALVMDVVVVPAASSALEISPTD